MDVQYLNIIIQLTCGYHLHPGMSKSSLTCKKQINDGVAYTQLKVWAPRVIFCGNILILHQCFSTVKYTPLLVTLRVIAYKEYWKYCIEIKKTNSYLHQKVLFSWRGSYVWPMLTKSCTFKQNFMTRSYTHSRKGIVSVGTPSPFTTLLQDTESSRQQPPWTPSPRLRVT